MWWSLPVLLGVHHPSYLIPTTELVVALETQSEKDLYKGKEKGVKCVYCMTNATFLRRRQKADDSFSAFVSYYNIYLLIYG